MNKRTCQKQNKNSDKFGRRRTFGFPIDISYFESAKYRKGKKNHNDVLEAVHKLNEANGNPLSILIDKEESKIDEEVRKELSLWLQEAMERLPENQEACIYLRFGLDKLSISNKKKLRPTAEVAKIVGISQSTAYRNIQRGLKKLKKDYKANIQEKIKRIKS